MSIVLQMYIFRFYKFGITGEEREAPLQRYPEKDCLFVDYYFDWNYIISFVDKDSFVTVL